MGQITDAMHERLAEATKELNAAMREVYDAGGMIFITRTTYSNEVMRQEQFSLRAVDNNKVKRTVYPRLIE